LPLEAALLDSPASLASHSHRLPGVQSRLAEAGAQAFFQKPFDNEELLATIDRALGTAPAE
jgi:FixJ family two-component response regulator